MHVAELKAKTPSTGLLPVAHGAAQLVEVDLGVVTSVMALGDKAGLSASMKAAHGVGFPEPNRTAARNGLRCIWSGRNQALLTGVVPDASLLPHGVLVDQSDGWAAVRLSGAASEDVLARLVPVDLRVGHFKRGHTARTLLGHMTASVTRTGADEFLILVFRSMAITLVDEISRAMQAVESRTR